jgi:hypothetical protein
MGWPEVLDDMEEHLAAHERSLRDGVPPPVPVEIPPGIGPLPADLFDRAEEILAAAQAAARRVNRTHQTLAAVLRGPEDVGPH